MLPRVPPHAHHPSNHHQPSPRPTGGGFPYRASNLLREITIITTQHDHTTQTTAHSHRERDDNYSRVVLTFSDKWRLIGPDDGSQWILQHRASRDRWTGKSYFSRAKYVPQRVRELVGEEAFEKARDWVMRTSLAHV